jgi:hypothetical protein
MSIKLEDYVDIIDFPLYVYSQDKFGRIEVFKQDADKKTEKYLILNKECTCKGFQNLKKCKHLQFLEDKYNSKGLSKELACIEVEKVCKIMNIKFGYTLESLSEMPDKIGRVNLTYSLDKNTTLICWEKKLISGSLLFRITK